MAALLAGGAFLLVAEAGDDAPQHRILRPVRGRRDATWWIRIGDPDATVSALFDRLLDDRAVRIAVIVIWWWLGWFFLAGQTL